MNSTIEQLKLRLGEALAAAFGEDFATTDPVLVPASNPKFGDYQANVALSLTKRLGQAPRSIAEKIVEHLDISEFCLPPEIAGPGFINLTLNPRYLEAQLQVIQTDDRLGVPQVKDPQRIIVDFSSPNIAKEMHVGHLRSTIIGDCIARVLEFQGHDVLRLNHVGDWGTQFGMLITYLREVCPQALTTSDALDLGDLVEFYKQAKQRFDEDEAFRETARQEVVRLQSGAEDTLRAWRLLCDQSRREFQVIYDLLDVCLTERGESFYNPFLPAVTEDLEKLNLLVEDEGAKCVFLEGFTNKEGNPLPLIVQKSDGGYNYATTDLAAVRYRIQEDRAQRILYLTDVGQANHFAQVFQVAKRAGWVPDEVELVHVPFGFVQGEDGKKFKTRSGDTVKLRDLLDEAVDRARTDLENRLQEEGRQETPEFIDHVAKTVGLGAVKYADLSQNRTSNYIFSYDKMLALQGNTAPYMLYAYVRIQGISRKGSIDFQALGSLSQSKEFRSPSSHSPNRFKLSLTTFGLFVITVIGVRVIAAILLAIHNTPLLEPVLELVGFGLAVWVGRNKLLFARDRQPFLESVNQTWISVTGVSPGKTLSAGKSTQDVIDVPAITLPPEKKLKPSSIIQLEEETELVLAKHLLQLDEILATLEADLFPNRLCQYLFELSQKFNQFYDRCPVLTAEEPQRTSRLLLCDLTARTLKLGLSLLGIPVLERM